MDRRNRIYEQRGLSMTELISEPALAKKIGVGRTTVRDIRRDKLLEGEHWTLDTGKVTYTPEGVEAVLHALHAKKTGAAVAGVSEVAVAVAEAGDGLPVRGDTLPVADEDGIVDATVMEWRGTRWLTARLLPAELADGRKIRVRVRDNIHFRGGMKIRVRLDAPDALVGGLAGRAPRFAGRW